MKVKEGKERNEAIKQINDDEELREIAREDPDAILLHDPEGSVILNQDHRRSVTSNIRTENLTYENNVQFLVHRLKINNGSLDKLCKELDYSPYDFLTDSCLTDGGDSFSVLINEAYDGESLGDLYNETV